MRRRISIALQTGLAGLFLAGCSSFRGPHVGYDFPRVTGRVLDEITRQPVADASVQPKSRVQSDSVSQKGATQLISKQVAFTNPEGRFTLESEKSFYFLFGHSGGYQASIVVQRRGYRVLRTNLLVTASSPGDEKGPPQIQAGDLFLTPIAQ
jgi:hypothetical protein